MCLKMNLLSWSIVTERTFKWFLANMSSCMIDNVASLISTIVASETCKFKFNGIRSIHEFTFFTMLYERVYIGWLKFQTVNTLMILWKRDKLKLDNNKKDIWRLNTNTNQAALYYTRRQIKYKPFIWEFNFNLFWWDSL